MFVESKNTEEVRHSEIKYQVSLVLAVDIFKAEVAEHTRNNNFHSRFAQFEKSVGVCRVRII